MLTHHEATKAWADVNLVLGTDSRLYVKCISRSFTESGKPAEVLDRERYFIHFVERGRVMYDGTPADTGEVFLMAPGTVHRLENISSETLIQYCIEFQGSDAALLCADAGLSNTSRHRVADPRKMREIFREAVYETDTLSDAALVKMALGLLYYFLSQLVLHEPREVYRAPDYVRRAEEFMRENYMYGISAGDAARAVGLTEKYLCRLFGRELGMTPTDYLADCRIRRALELLRSHDLSVGEIASMVGIDDPAYFSRFIRQKTGKSPSAHRTDGRNV